MLDIHITSPTFYVHRILLEKDNKPIIEHQRWLNLILKEVVQNRVIKWLDACKYPISDNQWVTSV